jgi:preprotein translocase subunit SecG
MSGLISALIIICCFLLILVVLVQNSKGGGLSSSFASTNQIMGVRKTTDFLEKTTWTLAIVLVVLCLASSAINKKPTLQKPTTEEAP